MASIYLAARYSRLTEIREYADKLKAWGHDVTSDWMYGELDHAPSGEEWANPAIRDKRQVKESDVLIAFTEDSNESFVRGSRHVELGMAIAWEKRVIIVGPRENVFCYLPECHEMYDFWFDFVMYCNLAPKNMEMYPVSGEEILS